jgi:hypothetical protein
MISCSSVPETDRRFCSYAYQLAGNGRWQLMALKKPKKVGKGGKRKAAVVQHGGPPGCDEDDDAVIKTPTTKNTEVAFQSCSVIAY